MRSKLINRYRFSTLFFILFLGIGWIYSETWKTYTNLNFINDILGDDSTLYVATAGGVVVIRTTSNTPEVKKVFTHTDGLRVNKCLSIAQDSEGNIWIGTYGGGLAVILKELGYAVSYSNLELPLRIRVVGVNRNRVFVGSEYGLYVIETQGTPTNFSDDRIRRWTVVERRELLSDRILSILPLNSHYWIGSNQGVTFVDTSFSHWRAFRRPLGDSVLGIGVLPDGRVILATELGLAIGDTSGFQPLWIFPSVKKVKDLAVCGYDIYLATSDTVFKVDTAGNFQFIFAHAIQSLWIDKSFWIGGGGDEETGVGLFYLKSGASWQRLDFGSIYSNFISDCAFGDDGSIYLVHGLYGSNIVSRILPDGKVSILRSPLSWILQVRRDSKGRLWFAHFWPGGVSMYDPGTNKWKSFTWSGQKNTIMAFGIDRFDTKWVYNQSGTLVAIDSNENQQEFILPELVPPPGGGYEISFDSKNKVWIGLTNGLEEFDYNGTLSEPSDDYHTIHTAGLPSTEVRSVAVDQKDRVWVATPQGAAFWEGNKFTVYTTANSSILSNNLYRVRVDGAGRVWFLSDSGLSVYDVATRRWMNYKPYTSGIIPNPQSLADFYITLTLNDSIGLAGIGTARGFSLFDYAAPYDTVTTRLRVYPNPYIGKFHSGLRIEGLPNDAQVRIYTLSGKVIADLSVSPGSGRAIWEPKDVKSGIYIILAASKRGFYTERVAVVSP